MEKRANYILGNDISKWSEEIFKYMSKRYKFILDYLSPVEITNKSVETRDATGVVRYDDGKTKISIPIIVDEGTLQEPNVGIDENEEIVPIVKEYFEKNIINEIDDGVVARQSDKVDHSMFLQNTGLFDADAHDVMKVGSVCCEATNKMIKEELPEISDEFMSKTAGYRDDVVVAKTVSEVKDLPYHYDVVMLKHAKSGRRWIEQGQISEDEMSKIAIDVSYGLLDDEGESKEAEKMEYIRIDDSETNKNLADGKIHKVDSDGAWGVFTEDNQKIDMWIIKNPETIWGGKSNNILGFEKNKDKWVFDKDVYGEKEIFANIDYNKIIEICTNDEDINAPSVVSFVSKNYMTIPYEILRINNVLYGPEMREIISIDIKSLEDGTTGTVLYKQRVDEITELNEEKCNKIGISTNTNSSGVYALPENISMKYLETRVESIDPSDSFIEDLKKEGFAVETKLMSGYPYNITMKENGVTYDFNGLDKKASLLVMNYYTGRKENTIDAFNTHYGYISKNASGDELSTERSIDKIAPYKGEFVKIAKFLLSQEKYFEKTADVNNLAREIAGLEYVDEFADENIDEFKSKLEDIMKHIGRLLLYTRLQDSSIDQNSLNNSYNSLIELWSKL